MTVEQQWLIDNIYRPGLDNAKSSYEIDFFRNAIASLRAGACPVCHADLPKERSSKLLGEGLEVVVKKGKPVIIKI
jgi:DNA repair exonuclease SbcCD ATPase subunit